MRILGVRFKNLNSLAGEWQIDFTHPAFASDGIFAIIGPTGAGKTTIMDAVCLALYGQTPRLGKVTKGGNELMSRLTGECFAEVTFETGKGRFRCHWGQHRARKSPDGELQQARHEIAEADTGKVLESKINQTVELIETVTGMDFGRFTRSMLLAQGGFAAFLQAPPGERSPILEQITGTGIYSRISMQVHERRAAELAKCDLMQTELKGIRILGEEEEREERNRLQEKQRQEADLDMRLKELGRARDWLEAIAGLERELGELERRRKAFEERWQGFAADAARLERGTKALGLEADYRSLTDISALQARETRELQAAQARLPEEEKAGREALAAKAAAEHLLNEARTRQAAEGEVIRKVRDLDVRLAEQLKQLAEKMRAIEEIERQGKVYRGRIEDNERKLKSHLAALEALHEYRTTHAADALLLTRFSGIERGFTGLQAIETKYSAAREGCSRAGVLKESALATLTRAQSGHDVARRSFETGQRDFKILSDEVTALLQGRDIGQWRTEAEALKERERLLVQAAETAERVDRTAALLGGLEVSLQQATARRAGILAEVESASTRRAVLEKDVADLETRVALLGRIRDLEEERKRLEDGRPCPLCGATEHPYAKGNLPVPDDAEAELKEKKDGLKEAYRRLAELEAGRAATAAEIEHGAREMTEKTAALKADQRQGDDLLLRLKIEVSPAGRAGKIREEIAAIRARIEETANVVTRAEEKGREEKSAQASLEAIRKGFDEAGRALQEAGHVLQRAGLDFERRNKECADLNEELENTLAEVLADLRPFGISAIPPDGLSEVLKDLTGRKERWETKDAERAALEKTSGELKAALEKDRALLDNLEADLSQRRIEHDGLKREHESVRASRHDLFGQKDTDAEEMRLTAIVDQENGQLEKAREVHGLIDRETRSLKDKITSLQARTAERAAELESAEGHLRARILGAGFADEAAYRASRLTADERERLAEKEKDLLREKTELETRRKDKADTLTVTREKKLTEQSADALAEEIRAVDVGLKELRLTIGGIKKVLSVNDEQRKSRQERLKAIAAQQAECRRWDDLHRIIGSADGKKFRNFAQGLTFEMMTAHANRRLREMTDRYLLVCDEQQPLELNVIDNYQAGEIRSTKNLSGGESFIVSLALALGLSQMASRNVRVDSLFLDEGFGTLDEDALETALETLAGLRQDGKLIGVISHVAALKERITTQIEVIPGSGGRSSLSGPGCIGI